MTKRLLTGIICLALLVIALVPVSCNGTQTTSTAPTTTSNPATTQSTTSKTTNTTSVITTPTTTATSEEIVFPDIGRITPQDLKSKIEADIESVIILDTRDPASYAAGHLPRAANFEWSPVGDPEELNMKLWTLPSNKLIVVYCDCAGEETSGAMAERILEQVNISKDMVKALKGGISAWKALKYPLYSGATLAEAQPVVY